MMIEAGRICDAVKMADVLSMYAGGTYKPKGRCGCPLHKGKDLNFSYNETFFQCFVCGEKGNIISFVAKLFGLTNSEALRKIDDDFNLGIIGSKPKLSEQRKIEAKRKAEKERAESLRKLNDEFSHKTELLHMAEDLKRQFEKHGFDVPDKLVDTVLGLRWECDELLERVQNGG